MKKITVSVFVLSVLVCAVFVHFLNLHKNISSSLIRMHIIANSNSPEDQKIKLEIRDRILKKYSFAADDVEGERKYIEENITSINDDVNLWLAEKGAEYGAKSCLEVDSFPARSYGGLNLPGGKYTAFKVVLGDGMGQNWWCVMFPPLCFADSSVGRLDEASEKYLKNNLSEEEFSLITGSGVKLKFKILELINSLV